MMLGDCVEGSCKRSNYTKECLFAPDDVAEACTTITALVLAMHPWQPRTALVAYEVDAVLSSAIAECTDAGITLEVCVMA
mmetsp:Transcript_114072/g.295377  ORF Transcript_114072/g.295377 Transcript_114072/m.295377 type:complete len:80 (+) Transcript_114072:741-980(+)